MTQMWKVSKNNTKIRHVQDWTFVRLWNTDVVIFNDDWIILDTGGWYTLTTKTRMNQASHQYHLGYYVYQEKGVWHVHLPSDKIYVLEDELFIHRESNSGYLLK